MTQRNLGSWLFILVLSVLILPAAASAQSSIVGTVSDNSGAVLPGVTVEASSPVLIEKVRTTVTGGDGRYTIVDLRPGTYTITFTLPGFSTAVRDGFVLPADFTATVNVQLAVGALEETVTVSGQSPLVDVASSARTSVITRDLLDALPTPRNTQSFGYLAPGVRLSKPDVGGAQMMEQVNMRVHGASQLHTTMQIDGMLVSPAFNDGAIQNYMNQAHFGETAFTTSSQGAEVSAGGVRVNLIPRDGGNRYSGSLYLGFTDGSWQSDNLTDALRAQGVSAPTGITNIHDVNPSFGGPILQDKLWFFASMRWMSVDERVVNAYMPDGSQAIVDQYVNIPLVRMTWQATSQHKLSAFVDRPFKYKGREFTFGIEPALASRRRNPGEANYHNAGIKLTSTLGNRMLYELGFTQIVERLHTGYQTEAPSVFPTTAGWPRPATVRTCVATPCAYDPTASQAGQWYRDVSYFDIITQQRTNAATGYAGTLPDRRHITTALSYITGSHTLKGGFQWSWGQDRNDAQSNGDLSEQRYRNGVPEAVVVTIRPFATEEYVKADIGLYLQDTIRYKRLTMTPGLRYEYFNSGIKQQWREQGRFVEGRIFAPIDGLPIWHNVVPRFGATYDLFGDGRTALKFAANVYTRPMAGSFAKRYNPLRGTETDVRDWFDVELIPGTATRSGVSRPTDRDNIVQDWEIGPRNNAAFGIAPDRRPIEGIRRETNRELTASIQRQIFSGLSVTAGWYRRQYFDLIGEDNLLRDVTDFTAFQLANPLGNGEMITVYNLNPAKRGLVQIQDYNSDINTHISNDFELSFNSRLPNGSTVFGGWTAMKNVSVTCDTDNPNGFATYSDLYYAINFVRGGRFCDERKLDIPYRSDFKIAGTLPLPYDLEFSGTIVSFAGNETQTYWDVPASEFPNRQRTEAVRVRLTAPGTEYLDRWNQVDVALKKVFRVGMYNFTAQADVYNLLNGANVTTRTEAFGSSLGFPNSILQGRLLRLVAQVKW
jgi:hypothetical protein